MITIAILDDEHRMFGHYESIISKTFRDNSIKGEIGILTSNPDEFLNFVRSNRANVCIIDIDLKTNTNGISIARQIRDEKISTEIIFVSGMLSYITQLFELQAYNFITKPIGENLGNCIKNLSQEISDRNAFRKKIDIRFGDKTFYIPIDQITFIEHVKTKTMVHTLKYMCYETYEGLEELISRVDDPNMVRCHRAIFVNTIHIYFVDKKDKSITLDNGDTCQMGPKYSCNF